MFYMGARLCGMWGNFEMTNLDKVVSVEPNHWWQKIKNIEKDEDGYIVSFTVESPHQFFSFTMVNEIT